MWYYALSQWPRGLKRWSAAARLLGLRVRIPPDALMSVVNVVCCQVEVCARAGHTFRGVLPIVVFLSVIDEPQTGGLGPPGAVEP